MISIKFPQIFKIFGDHIVYKKFVKTREFLVESAFKYLKNFHHIRVKTEQKQQILEN